MRIWLLAAAVLFTAQAAPALAQDRDPYSGAPLPPHERQAASPITDHFYAQVAFYSPSVSTNFRVDPSFAAAGVTGTSVDGQTDLGLPSRLYQGVVEFMFRMRERNKVTFGYYEAKLSGSKVLANDIVFGNETFAAGQVAQTTFNWQQFDITYTYSFIRNNRFEVGTGLAVYFLQIDVIGQVPAQFQYQETSAAAPAPALPLDFSWAISRHWALTAHGAYVKATINGTHGWYADSHADAQYRVNPNFAVGAGYSSTRASLAKSSGSSPGAFDMSIHGPQLFVRLSF
jgi:hypothetical protein